MAEYRTLKPISVTVEDGVQHYPRPGAIVELDDEQALPLLLAGRVESTAEVGEFVAPVAVEVPQPEDPPVPPVETPTPDPEDPPAEAAAKRRGGRGEGDGKA